MIEAGARRREIDEVASGLFHANGYAATSIRDIARALDIQGASLYAHVASKEDLLWAIVDRAASAFELAADRAADETGGADAVERLAALVEAHVEVVTADPERSSVFVTEARFRATIADGIATGALRSTDPAIAATFILTALNGIANWYRPDGRLSPDRVADQYVDLALRSLSEDHR
jgi:TetR/AcrR family transcriptional regulator, cholesterol catabolism regulator